MHAATFTVTKTADTNDGVCNADCSLREAIGAANGNGGADTVAFNIPVADPGYNAGTGVFTISIGSTLLITDPATTIDGTTQTSNVGNTNPVVLGAGGTVGVGPDGVLNSGDELPLPQVAGPEIEIRDSGGVTIGLRAQANNTTIRGLAVLGFGTNNGEGDIRIDNGITGTLIEQNVLGTTADSFSDPGGLLRGVAGVHSEGGDSGIVRNNLVGFHRVRGIWLAAGSNNWNIQGNEIRDNGMDTTDGDGIAFNASASNTVTGNLVIGSSSQGVIVTSAGSNNNNIVNNTITGNGVGIASGVAQSAGVTLRGSAGPTVFDRNVIHANYGAGLQVNSGATSIRMTLNSFADNGTIMARDLSPFTNQIGIDLNLGSDDNNFGTSPFYNTNDDGDGDSGGNDIDNFAVIERAQIIGPNLVVSGFSAGGATIEFFISDGDPSNFGEGETYLFTRLEGSAQDSDGGGGSYGPGPVNGVAQGDESPVPRYQFTVPLASLVVAPTAADKLVATATVGGQTSEFSARAPIDVGTIAGTIFVDIVGDGLADGPIGPPPNPFESGARIELWLDGGDGIPDGGDDSYVTFTTSSGVDGTYEFSGLRNGTYWVTVDSGGVNRGPYNGGYSGADAWAEQTYGPRGAASFDGAVWSYAPAPGAFYGGAEWDVSDNFPPTNSLPTAEHIGRVVVADNDTPDIDFGFSFNVVTTTRGGDGTVDPGTPPGQRTVQGSLRQFITNANAQSGANVMRFVPAAPTNGTDAGNSWWRIDVSALLPIIADVSTTVDGLAYSLADGLTVVDPNDANIGAGETVGVDGLFTTPVLDPELELEVSGIDYGLQIDAASAVVRNISVWKSDENDFRVGYNAGAPFTGPLIEQNVIGTPPYRFDGSFAPTGNDLVDVFDDADSGTLQNNLMGFADGGGFSPEPGATSWLVFQNEIRGIGRAAGWGERQDAVGDGAPGIVVRGNLLVDSAGGGVDSYLTTGGHTIEQNTLRNNGTTAPEEFGIRIMGNSGSSIVKNIFDSNNGPAILVVSDRASVPYAASNANLISQNLFASDNAGIAIDLLDAGSPDAEHETGDGITLNDGGTDANAGNIGLDFPVIDSVALGANLTVTGYSRPGVTIEFYEAVGAANDQNTGGTAHGEGIRFLFSATEGSGADTDATTGSYASPDYGSDPAANRFSFTVPAPAGLSLGDPVSAIAIDGSNNTSEFGPNLPAGASGSIAGRVFEDVNYGGGAGRDQATASGVPRPGARVELYDAAGVYVTFTTTDALGDYSFSGLVAADYTVRVVNSTVTSSRTGYVPGLLSVQTYRTDASSGLAVPVTDRVGGQDPSVADAGSGSAGATMNTTTGDFTAVLTGTAQSITNVTVGVGNITGVDFGFNFDTIVNTNPAGQGSLDQVLLNANNLANAGLAQAGLPAGIETSLFMIPGPADSLGRPVDPGWDGSAFVISLLADLPIVTDPARIDGYTQENTQPNTVASPGLTDAVLLIKLEGTGAIADGFNITAGGSTVRGMIVTRFPQDGIELASNGNTVEGNYIGTDATGAALGNDRNGVRCDAASNVIGGSTPGARNVISSNGQNGLVMSGASATGNVVRGNYIGTNVAGTLGLGNSGWGIRIQGNASSNTLGGTAAGEGSVFADNGLGGIRLNGTNTVGQVIHGNLIGTDAAGTGNLGNSGPGIQLDGEAWDTTIGGIGAGESNIIAFNAAAGVTIQPGGTPPYENPIRGNSIHSNGGLGIDLDDDGATGNDAAPDDDDGANRLQNYPLLATAGVSGGSTTVTGTLTSDLGTTYDIDFYSNPAADVPSGFGEGEVYLGSDSVTTDGTGVATINTTLPVAVTIGHVVTATATDPDGNTSEFGPNVPATVAVSIAGLVFDDIAGDGLPGAQATGDATNPGVGSVMVYLYDDAGATAGQPDATDGAVASTATAADGSYSFAGVVDGTYWVVVDSKTLSADTNVWGEQTYGPPGGWCADGAGGTVQGIGAAGVCYGGRRVDPVPGNPSSDDLTSWHSGAEHIAELTVAGGDVNDVDFGFSFNVVTTTRGGDATDDDGATPRTVQGSLRQFIDNANAIAGASAMRFVPGEPSNASAGAHGWWQIPVSSAQPQITGAATTIDGAAYDFADGTTLLDTNTAAIGAGAAVGVSATFNTPQLDPELELRGDGVVNVGLEIRATADGSAIRNVAINAFSLNAVRLIGVLPDDLDNATLENTVIGTSPASFTDDPLLSTGRALFARDLSNATIRNNLAGWLDWGFQVQFDTFDSLIETNEIRGCAVHGMYVAGVAGTGQQPARITIRGNLVESSGSNAIHAFQALNQFTITENTLRLSGSRGIALYGVQNSVTSNVITDNSGSGLLVTGDASPTHPAVSQTRISQNRFGNNGGLAIDLVNNGTNPDGITLNDDTDADTGGANELHNFPVIESAVLAAGNLTVTGFARPGVDLEFYESAGAVNDQNGGGTAHGEGVEYLFTVTEGSGADTDASTGSYASPDYGADSAAERFRFVVPAPGGLAIGEELSAISIDTTDDTSEFGPNAVVTAPYNIIKRAFLPDGTPVGDGSALPVGVGFKFMLYINNKDGATTDATIRDVLDPLFAFVAGTIQVDNSVAECAAAACTPAEEAAIFASAVAAPLLSDAIDADVASFNGTDTVDVGNQFVANAQLNIAANTVLAVVFSAKIQ